VTKDYNILKEVTGTDTAGDGIINNPGEIIEYKITVNNTGNQDITGASVSDPLLVAPDGSLSGPMESLNPDGVLEVGENWMYTGSYTVTQEDFNSNATLEPDNVMEGTIDNTATLTAPGLPDKTSSTKTPIECPPCKFDIFNSFSGPNINVTITLEEIDERSPLNYYCRARAFP
jgi:hypothetical protein